MKKIFLTKKFGFSLAEALITLLIVCLITLASIPVLTKKRRNLSADSTHGKWICTRNSEGQTVYWSDSASSGDPNNPDTWDKTGQNYCKFVPPMNARNFAVTIAGAGGGGASATKLEKFWTSDFAVEYTGKYRMVAIGAGGDAGDTGCYKKAGGGGGGGIGYLEYNADENVTQIIMHKGNPGNSGDKKNGDRGDDSFIKANRYNPSTGNNDTITLLYAEGGGGGGGRWGAENFCKHGNGKAGDTGNVSSDVAVWPNTFRKLYTHPALASCGFDYCFGYVDSNAERQINYFLSPYVVFDLNSGYENKYGRGGQPNRSTGRDSKGFQRNGQPGYVMVMAKIYKAGQGGKSGQSVSSLFYPKFEAKYLKAVIGEGGRGGAASNTSSSGNISNGYKGGDTTLLNDKNEVLLGKQGGAGGNGIEATKTFVDTPGGNGELSTLFYPNNPQRGVGGLNTLVYSSTETQTNNSYDGMKSKGYGDGGGGGGYSAEQNKAGNGADGAPGVVIIEW